MKKIIEFFATKHLFSNFIFIGVLAGGIFFWSITGKEELPEMTADFVRVSVSYPGASAEDVEQLVTWPMENELRSVDGIDRILSTSSEGSSSISLELEKDSGDRGTVISDIRNTVQAVKLPEDIIDLPNVREFKTSRKAVIDIALYFNDRHLLNDRDRRELQAHARTLERRLLALPQVNSINRRGYLDEEIHILLNPELLVRYRIPVSTIISEIRASHMRQPAGSLESALEERVTVDAELNRVERLSVLPIQGTFDGNLVHLSRLATIKDTFEESTGIMKVNGHEAVILNAVKNSASGILDAVDAIKHETASFGKSVSGHAVTVVILDDESRDVRNRLSLIGSNGLIGFIFILIFLFIFLSFKAGFWVAMGIPFTFGMTMIIASLWGFTINNITLSAVIIVMGMIVDDAIVVSENIMRLRAKGVPMFRAAVEGTSYVLLPITASILTTCAAFLPLLSFQGHMSMMTDSIPPIVTLMLMASLIESLFILPAHMSMKVPRWVKMVFSLGSLLLVEKYFMKSRGPDHDEAAMDHWFHDVEDRYAGFLSRVLARRTLIIILFVIFTAASFIIARHTMNFALFPREESDEVLLVADAPEGTKKLGTAMLARKIESILEPYLATDVVGFRTMIGESFHRASTQENVLKIRIELVPADRRRKSYRQLTEEWKQKIAGLKEFSKVRFSTAHFGSSSGSPIEVVILENDNNTRRTVSALLEQKMKDLPFLMNAEIGEPYRAPEYRISLNRDMIKRLDIRASDMGQIFRTALEGTILYRFLNGDEEKNVRLTLPASDKLNIEHTLSVPVANTSDYLVPLRELVTVEKTRGPTEIKRIDLLRSTMVYADINPGNAVTPLEAAEYLEAHVFPEINAKYPGVIFSYEGEIKMTRESSGFFVLAMLMAFFLIYVILALQFNSLWRPVTIMLAIPPALASVIFIFKMHGIDTLGFFGIIGAIGLCGVVVNDAIVLLTKLDDEKIGSGLRSDDDRAIASTSSTRLRAVLLTTLTTAAGLLPTAYGVTGYDSMLAEMMLALAWGLILGTLITLVMIPSLYSLEVQVRAFMSRDKGEAKA